MRIIISILLCVAFVSCSKKDEEIKKISQDLKDKEQKLTQERKDLEKLSEDKEEELKKAKDEYDKVVDENNKSGKFPGKFPFASVRELTDSDLVNLTPFDRKILRNEILARHGYIFKDEEMKFYFSGQKWYTPKYNDVDKMLTDKERNNIEGIDLHEKRLKK
jgi:hypothetical protein